MRYNSTMIKNLTSPHSFELNMNKLLPLRTRLNYWRKVPLYCWHFISKVRSLGCESFALLFDDIEPQLHPADEVRFQTPAHAQAYVTNEVYHHMGAPNTFLFCPTG